MSADAKTFAIRVSSWIVCSDDEVVTAMLEKPLLARTADRYDSTAFGVILSLMNTGLLVLAAFQVPRRYDYARSNLPRYSLQVRRGAFIRANVYFTLIYALSIDCRHRHTAPKTIS